MIRIGLIGDYSKEVRAHQAIPKALSLIADDRAFEVLWVPTILLEDADLVSLMQYDALWCTPGSPYRSTRGALRAIQFAREKGIPFLGTCGGFQHAVIEYFRNVMRIENADHTEMNPEAEEPVVRALSCSLVGKTGNIFFEPASHIARLYGGLETTEEFHCNYGFNPDYYSRLNGAMHITGRDSEKEARVLELGGHPFYIATLFQPELAALRDRRSPVIRGFFQAATFRYANRQSLARV